MNKTKTYKRFYVITIEYASCRDRCPQKFTCEGNINNISKYANEQSIYDRLVKGVIESLEDKVYPYKINKNKIAVLYYYLGGKE